jgi:hypothetical protein
MIAFHDEPAKIFQWEVGAASTCSSFARPLLVPGPGRARGVGMGAPVGPSLRASRGDPGWSESFRTPGMSLGTSTCCLRRAATGRAKGGGPGPGGTLVCGRPGGTSHRNAEQVGDGRPAARANCSARKYHGSLDRPVELFRRGRLTPEPFRDRLERGGPERGACMGCHCPFLSSRLS